MPINRVHVVINPAAGKNQPILNTLNDVFKPYDIEWNVSITLKRGDGVQQAKRAVDDGYDVVAAFGGDGTLNEVACALAGSNVPMAVLPGGTTNAVAHNYDIPIKLARAAELIVGNHYQRTIDLGIVGSHPFLLHAAIGFIGKSGAHTPRPAKDVFGNLAYVVSGLRHLKDAQSTVFQLTLDGRQVEAEGLLCLILNIPQISPHLALPEEIRADDGLLDLLLLGDAQLKTLSQLTGSVLTGGVLPDPMQHYQFRMATIAPAEPQPVSVDGERIEDTPAIVRIQPSQLKLIVPA